MDSESGSESGAHRSSRAHSVASAAHGDRDQSLSAATAALSISCSDLRGRGRSARAVPALCEHHRPPHVCERRPCDALHLCRLYVDGFCPRDDATCRWGHAVTSADNWDAVKAYELQGLSERELLWLVRSLLRQTAPVSAEEYRRELALCDKYSADACCGRLDCFRLHLCPHLVSGECRAGARCCWSHRLTDPDNVMLLLRLKCVDLTEDEVLTRLARQRVDEDGAAGLSGSACSQPTAASAVSGGQAGSTRNGWNRAEDGERSSSTSCSSLTEQVSTEHAGARPGSDVRHGACAQNSGLKPQSGAASAKNTPKTPPSKDNASVITSLDLCPHRIGQAACNDDACQNLHLCRLYVAGMCPYGKKCRSGHAPCTSDRNRDVLRRLMLLGVTEDDLLKGLRVGYLSRNPITDQERRFALQACRPYQRGSCKELDCLRLHICLEKAMGTCNDSSKCGLSHDINVPSQTEIIRRVGLATLEIDDVLDILKNPLGAKDAFHELTSRNGPVVSSGSDVIMVESDNSGGRVAPDQAQKQLCSSQLNSVSPDSRAPTADGGHLQEVHSQMPGSKPGPGSVPGEDTLRTSAQGSSADDAKRVAISLDLCHQNIRPSVCVDEACQKLHLCRFYIAEMCPYGKKCARGHKPCTSAHNKGVLERHGIPGVTEADLLKGLRTGYLSRNPITDLERQFLLQLCRPYQDGNCKNAECFRLHICTEYAMGTCKDSSKCGLSHQINSPVHAVSIRRLGLSSLEVKDLLELLKNPLNEKDVFCGVASRQRTVTSSVSAPIDVKSEGRSTPGPVQKPPCASSIASDTQGSARPVSSSVGCLVPDSARSVTGASEDQSSMLCAVHSSGGRCVRTDCDSFHVCGFFLASLCRRPDASCPLGHSFQTEHNVRVMQARGLVSGSAKGIQTLLDRIALQARVTFKNDAQQQVNMCIPYNSPGGCSRADGCKQFHVCHRFLAGTCAKTGCGLRHSLAGDHNRRVRGALGLAAVSPGVDPNATWATDRDLLELLRAKMALKPGVYPFGQTESSRPVASSASPALEELLPAPDTSPTMRPNLPAVCQRYGSNIGCTDTNCAAVHLCPHFLAASCRRHECTLGHLLTTDHNREALRLNGQTVTDRNHDDLVKALYTASPHVRRTELYAVLRLCTPNNTNGCEVSGCTFIHVCHKFIAGSCKLDECRKGHDVQTTYNMRKLLALHLDDASADEILEMLRAVYACRSVCGEPRGVKGYLPVSGDSLPVREPFPASGGSGNVKTSLHASGVSAMKATPPAPGGYVAVKATLPACVGSSAVTAAPPSTGVSPAVKATASPASVGSPAVKTTSLASDISPAVKTTLPAYAGSPDVKATLPAVCQQYGSTMGCLDAHCAAVHICPHFLAASCRRQKCTLGHLLTTEHNREVLRRCGQTVTDRNHDAVVKVLYTASPHIQRTELYKKLRVCNRHGSIKGCTVSNCTLIHICHRFIAGCCRLETCDKGHQVQVTHNKEKLEVLGLGNASKGKVLEMLRAIHACRSVCGDSLAVETPLPASSGPSALEASLPPSGATPAVEATPSASGGSLAVKATPSACSDSPAVKATQSAFGGSPAVKAIPSASGDSSAMEATPPPSGGSHAVKATLSASSDSPAEKKPLPTVCQQYGSSLGCSDANCAAVHICPHFLAAYCRRQHCTLEHRLTSDHNREALRRCGRTVADESHADLIQEMYAVSPHIRRTEVYLKLRVCDRHMTKPEGCKLDSCMSIHICSKFVAGTCVVETCGKGHQVRTTCNNTKLLALGLEAASSDEILEMLRAVHDWRSVCPLKSEVTSKPEMPS